MGWVQNIFLVIAAGFIPGYWGILFMMFVVF